MSKCAPITGVSGFDSRMRLTEVGSLLGNPAKAKRQPGWAPKARSNSCSWAPKHAPQPMSEDCLLVGPLEPTNEGHAIAKIAGIKMCQAPSR